jgi:hypothetical protein
MNNDEIGDDIPFKLKMDIYIYELGIIRNGIVDININL